jgi:DNA-binding PadR family transcriptional regulator
MPRNSLTQAEKCFSLTTILIELSKGKKLTGYSIATKMSKFGFNISPGTVYSQLGLLTRDGIIIGKKQSWGKTEKTVYEMTKKGREVFEEFKERWIIPLQYVYNNLTKSS